MQDAQVKNHCSHSQKDQKLVLKTSYHLMLVKNIAECSTLIFINKSYHLSFKSWFCLFLNDRYTQVLLYVTFDVTKYHFVKKSNSISFI